MRKPPTRSLLSRAIGLLARRDHSRTELGAKLMRYVPDGGDLAEVTRVLDELDRKHLLSDERFAAGLARVRSKRFGDARIRHDLRRVGIAEEISAAALASLSGSEAARAYDVWSKRFASLPASAAEHAKQARFLQSRGFSFDSISTVLRGRAGID
ncbi:MAG: recombination regulator RecX [Burkholderiaceae bacterium]|nr:recombination regulator RecX [Burkholderiaceae bacterium]